MQPATTYLKSRPPRRRRPAPPYFQRPATAAPHGNGTHRPAQAPPQKWGLRCRHAGGVLSCPRPHNGRLALLPHRGETSNAPGAPSIPGVRASPAFPMPRQPRADGRNSRQTALRRPCVSNADERASESPRWLHTQTSIGITSPFWPTRQTAKENGTRATSRNLKAGSMNTASTGLTPRYTTIRPSTDPDGQRTAPGNVTARRRGRRRRRCDGPAG